MGIETIAGITWICGFSVYIVCHYKSLGMKRRNNLSHDIKKIKDRKSGKGGIAKLF